MKKLLIVCWSIAIFYFPAKSQFVKKISDKVKDKTEQKAGEKTTTTPDNTGTPSGNDQPAMENTVITKDTTNEPAAPSLKVYANYDFVPGNKIIFEDNFTDDQDGEFPTHWELKAGQALLNKIGDELAFVVTDGNYARIVPRIRNANYLTDSFTLEYDYFYVPGAYTSLIILKSFDKELGFERESHLFVGNNEASFSGASNVSLAKEYPEALATAFENKWHHIAIAFKNHQLKVYVDQYRVLVVPDTKEDYLNLLFAGIGNEQQPIVFKNVRIAAGAGMNMPGKKFTETRIVTHGINFDVNKATIKAESMGTLNMIVQVMKDNPGIRFEVGGHTDADGDDRSNMDLSQQRANAVKEQLIKMGIDANRLTTEGYGESKPVSDNNTIEGKANNRRVEFVKI